MTLSLRSLAVCFGAVILTLVFLTQLDVYRLVQHNPYVTNEPTTHLRPAKNATGVFDWAQRPEHYPADEYVPLPDPLYRRLPRVQHEFRATESSSDRATRYYRQSKIKFALQRCWSAYRENAWLHDELAPISGGARDPFGGWAATLVDTLDTLWIMDLKAEFTEAVEAVMEVDFTKSSQDEINTFETTIRYLGGLLSAYDLSGDVRLLDKSLDLADMLYAAFDTPNRMPITRWDFQKAMKVEHKQTASDQVLVAEIGSLSLEFTCLAQITHNRKWYDAVSRITDLFDQQQNSSNLPGMWPMVVSSRDQDFASGTFFTLGAMADSLYEYLPKMYALLGGSDQYARLYQASMSTTIRHSLFRPMVPGVPNILMTGGVDAQDHDGEITLKPEGQHLSCFAGGMLALGGRLVNNETHVDLGRRLTEGCIWAYDSSSLGIMPEVFTVLPCASQAACDWDESKWLREVSRRASGDEKGMEASAIAERERLPPGFTSMSDRRYILRPEAIESVFILYRITGDPVFQQAAWRMFKNIQQHTKTEMANTALSDMSQAAAVQSDSMESFWTAETLKYFYLTFSDPNLISLDEYVFNTEAHPLKRVVTSH